MKLHTEIRNNRGGKKSTSDDTRILVELSYKNRDIGTLSLYAIEDLGFRVLWNGKIIEEKEEGKKQKGDKCYCSESGLSVPHYKDDH